MSRSIPQIGVHSVDGIFVTDSKKGTTETKCEHVGDDGTDEEEGLGSVDDCVAGIVIGLCQVGENTSRTEGLDQEEGIRRGVVEGDRGREPFRETEDLGEGVPDSN